MGRVCRQRYRVRPHSLAQLSPRRRPKFELACGGDFRSLTSRPFPSSAPVWSFRYGLMTLFCLLSGGLINTIGVKWALVLVRPLFLAFLWPHPLAAF